MTKSWYSDLPKFYQRQIAAIGLDDAGLARRRLLKGVAAASVGLAMGTLSSRQSQAARK